LARKESETTAIGIDGFDQGKVIFGLHSLLQKFVRLVEQHLGFRPHVGGRNARVRIFAG
jgi:hypothetical protein